MLRAGGRVAARPPTLVGRPATATPEALCARPLDHCADKFSGALAMTSVTLRGMTVETRTYRIAAIDPEDRTALDASYEIRRNARARDVPELPTLARAHLD